MNHDQTILLINARACDMLLQDGKAHLDYALHIRQALGAHFDGRMPVHPMWYIEYYGKSLLQPFITVSGITPEGVIKRFQEELNQFTPMSLADIEAAGKKEVANG